MLVQQTITFVGGGATEVAPAGTNVTELFIEPLRANAAVMFVGNSSLTQTGSAGVISDLAVPAASNGILDRFQLNAKGSAHNYDASALYVWGTTGQGCKVTYWTV